MVILLVDPVEHLENCSSFSKLLNRSCQFFLILAGSGICMLNACRFRIPRWDVIPCKSVGVEVRYGITPSVLHRNIEYKEMLTFVAIS